LKKSFDFANFLNERKKVVMAILANGMAVSSNTPQATSSVNDHQMVAEEKNVIATSSAAVNAQSQDQLNQDVSPNDAMEIDSPGNPKKRLRSESTNTLVHAESLLESKKPKPDDEIDNQKDYRF
jgi:hypothetical protein